MYKATSRFSLCSTHWMQVLIPRLHQFFGKFGTIFGSWRPSLIVFRLNSPNYQGDKVFGPDRNPVNFKAAYHAYQVIRYTQYSTYCIVKY